MVFRSKRHGDRQLFPVLPNCLVPGSGAPPGAWKGHGGDRKLGECRAGEGPSVPIPEVGPCSHTVQAVPGGRGRAIGSEAGTA